MNTVKRIECGLSGMGDARQVLLLCALAADLVTLPDQEWAHRAPLLRPRLQGLLDALLGDGEIHVDRSAT